MTFAHQSLIMAAEFFLSLSVAVLNTVEIRISAVHALTQRKTDARNCDATTGAETEEFGCLLVMRAMIALENLQDAVNLTPAKDRFRNFSALIRFVDPVNTLVYPIFTAPAIQLGFVLLQCLSAMIARSVPGVRLKLFPAPTGPFSFDLGPIRVSPPDVPAQSPAHGVGRHR